MKTKPNLLTGSLVAFGLTLCVSAQAAVVLSSDFTGVSKSGNTASGITWDTVNGIDTPATTMDVFDNANDAALSFFNVRPGQLDVDQNIGNGDTWRSSFVLDLDAGTSSIDLTSIAFVVDLTNGSGDDQANTTSKDGIYSVSIDNGIGSASTTVGSYASVTGNSISVDLSSLASLSQGTSYTLTFDVIESTSGWGHHVSLDSMTLNGTLTPVPEASTAMLLGVVGVLGFMARRKRA